MNNPNPTSEAPVEELDPSDAALLEEVSNFFVARESAAVLIPESIGSPPNPMEPAKVDALARHLVRRSQPPKVGRWISHVAVAAAALLAVQLWPGAQGGLDGDGTSDSGEYWASAAFDLELHGSKSPSMSPTNDARFRPDDTFQFTLRPDHTAPPEAEIVILAKSEELDGFSGFKLLFEEGDFVREGKVLRSVPRVTSELLPFTKGSWKLEFFVGPPGTCLDTSTSSPCKHVTTTVVELVEQDDGKENP